MDVNGTRFQLVLGRSDWENFSGDAPARAGYNVDADALTLRPLPFYFTPPTGAKSLPLAARRGASADRFGAVYWIGADRRSIWRRRVGQRRGERYWSASQLAPQTAPCAGDFTPADSPTPTAVELRGLVVTDHHYLVVGNRPGHELLVFDLFAGGTPVRLGWTPSPLEPWDLDRAPNGGFWVLDRAQRRYWLVDRTFRAVELPDQQPLSREGIGPGDFAPAHPPAAPVVEAPQEFPDGVKLTHGDPVSLAGLPDGSMLVLFVDGGTSASAVVRLGAGAPLVVDLANTVAVSSTSSLSITAYDMAYVPDSRAPLERGSVYLVERAGNQTFRFTVDWTQANPFRPEADGAYLPMQRYGGADLVISGDRVLYDVADRWIDLRPISRPRYEKSAEVISPAFDGGVHDSAWHRVLLDACVPPDSSVQVDVRVANDARDLPESHWLPQPHPYQRGVGTEIPYYVPGRTAESRAAVSVRADCCDPCAQDGAAPDEIDTIETLLQDVRGRWLQVRFRLAGTGYVSPRLHAARLHFPRFSYLDRYLPKVYRDDPKGASFVERLLADFEGLFTTWEGRIAEVERFFDAQAVPEEALDWLAGWLGVVAEPLWSTRRKRLFVEYLMELYRWHGTAHGVTMALRLFLEAKPGPSIFEPPVPLPLPCAPRPRSRTEPVRLVERFRTRRSGGAPDGLEAGQLAGDILSPLTEPLVSANAHRFVVLVPAGLSRERLDAVRRIVDLQKPAHTCYSLQTLWALFRIGTARLELDTDLGDGRCFEPLVLGSGYIGAGSFVGARHPFNIGERSVLNRDRFGAAPAL